MKPQKSDNRKAGALAAEASQAPGISFKGRRGFREVLRELFREETTGWQRNELIWLGFSVGMITVISAAYSLSRGLSLLSGDFLISLGAAVLGCLAAIFTGQGKLGAFVFGFLNSVLYGLISFRYGYYGEVMVKFLVFIPLNIYGFTVWIRHINPLGNETSKRSLSWTGRLYLLLTAILLTGGYGLFLTFLEGQYPFWDGFTTILATMALILCIMRYSEHWILWMIINAVSVGLWVAPFIDGRGKPLAVLLMWCFYLINSAVMYLRWRRHERLEKEAAQESPA